MMMAILSFIRGAHRLAAHQGLGPIHQVHDDIALQSGTVR